MLRWEGKNHFKCVKRKENIKTINNYDTPGYNSNQIHSSLEFKFKWTLSMCLVILRTILGLFPSHNSCSDVVKTNHKSKNIIKRFLKKYTKKNIDCHIIKTLKWMLSKMNKLQNFQKNTKHFPKVTKKSITTFTYHHLHILMRLHKSINS